MVLEVEYDKSKGSIDTQLLDLEDEVNDILDKNMESWFNEIVVPEAKRMASAMFLPEDFIESIQFKKTGQNTGKVVNNFGSPDVPLAIWFNNGTKRNYLIEPKVTHPKGTPRAARDKEDVGGGHVLHPSMLRWVDEFGIVHFAFSVIHPGFPKTLAMQFGVDQGKKRLMAMLPKLIEAEKQ